MGRPSNVTDEDFLKTIKDFPELNDRKIAKFLNCEKNVIYRKRIRLKIPNSTYNTVTLENFTKFYDLGMNDAEIARELEVSSPSVKMFREKLKFPSNNIPYEKQKGFMEKFLDAISSLRSYNKIAESLGIEKSFVKYLAKKHKLRSKYCLLVEENKIKESLKIPYIRPSTIIKELTQEENDILIGSLLGDASLFGKRKAKEGAIRHGLKQKEYCEWKFRKLERLCGKIYEYKTYNKKTNKEYYGIAMLIRSHLVLAPIYNMFYCGPNNKKRITEEVMRLLNPLSLAVWFMDDGSKCGKSGYKLCTNGFTKEDVTRAIELMKEIFNLDCTMHLDKNKPLIYIRAKSAKLFKSLVEPYIHPVIKYKLHNYTETGV